MTQFKDRLAKNFFFALLVPFLWMLFVHIFRSTDFGLSLWTARDFHRALNLLSEFQVCGSEMGAGFGMRLPGGAMYCLWFVPLFLTSSPVVLNICLVALHFCGIAFLFSFLRRFIGSIGAAVGCNIYLASFAVSRVSFQLWNPAVMPVFVAFALYAIGRVAEGRYEYLKWFFLSVALGMQMHLSVAFLFLPGILVTVIAAVNDKSLAVVFKQTALSCLAMLLLAFSPYIVSELMNGFANSRLVLFQEIVQDSHLPFGFRARQAVAAVFRILSGLSPCREDGSLSMLLGGGLFWRAFTVIADRGFLTMSAVGVIYAFCQRRTKRPVFLLALFFVTLTVEAVVFYIFFCWKLMVHIRYLYVLVPVLSFFAGLGVLRVYSFLRSINPKLCALWMVLVFAVCSFQVFANPDMRINKYSGHFSRARACLQAIRNQTGWSLEDCAGRTVFLVTNDDGQTWERDYDYFNLTDLDMSQAGKNFPGSGRDTGAVVLWDGARFKDEPEIVKDFARKYLRRDFTDISVTDILATDCELIIFYSRPEDFVFTGMSNRYILLPEEKTTLKFIDKLEPGKALDIGGGQFVVKLDEVIYLLLKFERTAEGAIVKIFSNQLRGTVSNYGFYMDGAISSPTLVWEDAQTGKKIETVIYEERIGFDGVFAPIEKQLNVPVGNYDLRFQSNVFALEMNIYGRPRGGTNEKRSRVDIALGRFEVK